MTYQLRGINPGESYTTTDINDFYIGIPMQVCKYIRIPLIVTLLKIIKYYNLTTLAKNGYVMVDIQRGMYGTPQVDILANKQIRQHLSIFCLHISQTYPWTFQTKNMQSVIHLRHRLFRCQVLYTYRPGSFEQYPPNKIYNNKRYH